MIIINFILMAVTLYLANRYVQLINEAYELKEELEEWIKLFEKENEK